MSRPIIRLHNTIKNEVIDREMNNDEFAQYELDQENYAARLAQQKEAKQASEAAIAKLARLGLTTDDLKALGL